MEEIEFLAPRVCALIPIPQLFEAADLLSQAAQAHIAGRTDDAATLILAADMQAIFEWSETLFLGKTISAEARRMARRVRPDPNKPPPVPLNERASGSIPMAIGRAVVERDGYVCRFCGVPVISPRAQTLLRKAYPAALRWGPRNVDKHTAFQALDLDWDHLIPRSLGGQNTLENLVVACAPCNCVRGNNTLAEIGLLDPRSREPAPCTQINGWDGLSRVLMSGRSVDRAEVPAT